MSFTPSKKIHHLTLIGICIISTLSLCIYFSHLTDKKNNKKDFPDFEKKLYQANLSQFSPPILGGQIVFGFGTPTESPYLEKPYQTPRPKFYVAIAEPDRHCVVDICGVDGSIIKTIGGWVQVYNTKFSETNRFFALDLPANKNTQTMIIVSDGSGKIVGIHPNKKFENVIDILKLYPDLANFDLANGVKEFKNLKVGETVPLKPGDNLIPYSESLDTFSAHFFSVPKNRKFYFYALQEKDYFKISYLCFLKGCQYGEPESDHYFLSNIIDYLDGWIMVNDKYNAKMAKLFGLNEEDVLSGKSSLVVLTDSKGVIVALHPNKTMSDAITILSQHPDIADVKRLYGE